MKPEVQGSLRRGRGVAVGSCVGGCFLRERALLERWMD